MVRLRQNGLSVGLNRTGMVRQPAVVHLRVACVWALVLVRRPQDLLAKLEERGEETARMAAEFAGEIRELTKELATARREETRLQADAEEMRLQLRAVSNDARTASDALAEYVAR